MKYIDLFQVGLLVLDKDLNITQFNNWIDRRLLPKPKIGQGILDIVRSDYTSSSFDEVLGNCLRYNSSHILTTKINTILPFLLFLNNMEITYNLFVAPLQGGDSERILLQFVDITPVIKREEFLKRKQEEIEAQQKLNFSRERMSALGELTSSIAHEINNPLAMLMLGNRLMEKTLAKKSPDLDLLKNNLSDNFNVIDRISNIIASVRNLSKGLSDNDLDNTNLKEIFDDINPLANELVKHTNTLFEVRIENDVLAKRIKVSRVLISQVFINLLNNSLYEIKENHHQDPFVRVSAYIEKKSLIILFEDSGEGIPKDIAEQIFFPFYTTKDFGEGTGLGLSTVYRIIKEHNGMIEIVEDAPNTCFKIVIPIIDR